MDSRSRPVEPAERCIEQRRVGVTAAESSMSQHADITGSPSGSQALIAWWSFMAKQVRVGYIHICIIGGANLRALVVQDVPKEEGEGPLVLQIGSSKQQTFCWRGGVRRLLQRPIGEPRARARDALHGGPAHPFRECRRPGRGRPGRSSLRWSEREWSVDGSPAAAY